MTDHTENMFTLEESLPFHAGARNNSNNHKKCSTANILILSKRSLVVRVRAALEEDGPLLCCVVLRRVCAVGTDSGFIQQGCAEDGALQPLDEEDGGGVFWVGFLGGGGGGFEEERGKSGTG